MASYGVATANAFDLLSDEPPKKKMSMIIIIRTKNRPLPNNKKILFVEVK